jgi:hypothetical protein
LILLLAGAGLGGLIAGVAG